MISWFLLVPARVPEFVFLFIPFLCPQNLFQHHLLVPSGFCSGFGAYLPIFFSCPFSEKDLCSIMIFSDFFWLRAGVPGFVPLLFFRFFAQEWGGQWILYCTWRSWKHGLLLIGAYAGVILKVQGKFRNLTSDNTESCCPRSVNRSYEKQRDVTAQLRCETWGCLAGRNWSTLQSRGEPKLPWNNYYSIEIIKKNILTGFGWCRNNYFGTSIFFVITFYDKSIFRYAPPLKIIFHSWHV